MSASNAHDRSVARLEDVRRSAVTDLGESGSALAHAAAVFASIAGAVSWSVLGSNDDDARTLARDLRLRGDELPAVVALPRRAGELYVVLGRLEGRFAALRLTTGQGHVFSPARVAETRRFLDEHGGVLTHWVVEGGAPPFKRTSAPVSFVVDAQLRPVLHEDRAGGGAPAGFYGTRDGTLQAPLERAIAQMVADLAPGVEAHTATRSLPFASVRVTRMTGGQTPLYLVAVEPLRRRSGVLRAITRFKLSRREGQVLTEALRGASSTEIAERLSIASSTATFHLKALLRKTGARNRAELTSRVLGWEEESP